MRPTASRRAGGDRISERPPLDKGAASLGGADKTTGGEIGKSTTNRMAIDGKTLRQIRFDRQAAAYCRHIMSWPAMAEWVQAAKGEPEELEELDAEF